MYFNIRMQYYRLLVLLDYNLMKRLREIEGEFKPSSPVRHSKWAVLEPHVDKLPQRRCAYFVAKGILLAKIFMSAAEPIYA